MISSGLICAVNHISRIVYMAYRKYHDKKVPRPATPSHNQCLSVENAQGKEEATRLILNWRWRIMQHA